MGLTHCLQTSLDGDGIDRAPRLHGRQDVLEHLDDGDLGEVIKEKNGRRVGQGLCGGQHQAACRQHKAACRQHKAACKQHKAACRQHQAACSQHKAACRQHKAACRQHKAACRQQGDYSS